MGKTDENVEDITGKTDENAEDTMGKTDENAEDTMGKTDENVEGIMGKTDEKAREVMEETHGPLIEFCYSCCSHGMMAGSSSSMSESLEWKSDDEVIYTYSSSGSMGNITSKYKVKPEVAQKLREYVVERKLAGLSKMDIPKPMVFDCFTSASITMEFDDSGIGGDRYESCFLDCGASKMTFKTLEEDVERMLEECEKTGELLSSEGREGGLPNLFSMGLSMVRPGESLFPNAKQAQGSVKKYVPGPQWDCECGATANTGKFCPECGEPRPADPAIWTCRCGAENKGNFCAECGSRKPDEA